MNRFLLLFLLVGCVLFGGCVRENIVNNASDDIACLLTVKDFPDKNSGDYLIEVIVFDKSSGEILSSPRLMSKDKVEAVLKMQKNTNLNCMLNTNSFGEISYNLADGVCFNIIVTKKLDNKTFTTKLLLIYQNTEDGRTLLKMIDVPEFNVLLNERILLFNHNGITIKIPLNEKINMKEEQILQFIPKFPDEQDLRVAL